MRRAPHYDTELPDDGDAWWACSNPERPHNPDAAYHDRCTSCQIALQALAHLNPTATLSRRTKTGRPVRDLTAADAHALIHDTADTSP